MNRQELAQTVAVIRLELAKNFFSRRVVWVYLLAFAPALLYIANSIYSPREQARLAAIAVRHPVAAQDLSALKEGMNLDDVVKKLGEPYEQHTGRRRVEGGRTNERAWYRYTDGRSDVSLVFVNGVLRRIERDDPQTLALDSLAFATIFRYYFLRVAVFFGCVGIFTNLFRGEMLDRSLHFYLLTPMRREMLLAGKYLSGLIATAIIFTSSTALQWAAMLWQFKSAEVSAFLAAQGWSHLLAYLGVTLLACASYGAIFMAAGLVFRNPVVPAAMVLLWESANLFLPVALKKLSLIFYLQSLCPVVAAPDNSLPPQVKLLISEAAPSSSLVALGCLFIFTLMVIAYSALRARNLEINYSVD
jgi:hypothetical protein